MALVALFRVMIMMAQNLILIERHHQGVLFFIQRIVLINLELATLRHEMRADRRSFSSRHFVFFSYPFVILSLSC